MIRRYRPHRRLRSEIVPLLLAALVPALLAAVFPREALRPFPSADADESCPAPCALVSLTAAEERKALSAARTAWQLDRGRFRRPRIDLFADTLPPMQPRFVLDLCARHPADVCPMPPYAPGLLPRTMAAPSPVTLSPQDDADAVAPAFSREDLLHLN